MKCKKGESVMSDFLLYVIVTGMLYLVSLCCVIYALEKTGKTKVALIATITIVFSVIIAFGLHVRENAIPLDAVEKQWKRYTAFCKENHISWSDCTFPEWLNYEYDIQSDIADYYE